MMPASTMLADFRLRIPLMAAPMFIMSSLELALACCRAGIIGAYQGGNPRTFEDFQRWIDVLNEAQALAVSNGERFAPYAVNLLATGAGQQDIHRERLNICEAARVPLLVTSIGDPSEIVKRAHSWGGRVFHDVTTIEHARKAAQAGVDGMMLTSVGAGGHAGRLSPFLFVRQVREFYQGALILAGGIATGAGIVAALALGADMVAMGTRFIASAESGAPQGYKEMIARSEIADILFTDAISGLAANFMRPSIEAVGLDPSNLPPPLGLHRPNIPRSIRAWRDVWSAGHSVALINDVPRVATIVDRLEHEFHEALKDRRFANAQVR